MMKKHLAEKEQLEKQILTAKQQAEDAKLNLKENQAETEQIKAQFKQVEE